MKRKVLFMFALLLTAVTQGAWAWDGSGTSADPYLIKTSADWKQLADDVSAGNSYSGQYFEMTADIDAQGVSVGASDKPFSGTFSGGMYTLTYNAGTISSYSEGNNAPFVLLKGAAIKDLKVTGTIYSKSMYAAGLACFVDGAKTTTISGCHVTTQMHGNYDLDSEANFGGFVAYVKSTSYEPLTFANCSFQGLMGNFTAGSACFVGFTRVPISLEHCMVDPVNLFQGIANTATFVRAADGVAFTLKECYYTQAYGTEQGLGVFKSVKVPDGCKAEMVSEPAWRFNGVDYYGSGAKVNLTVPEGTAFDHWVTSGKPVGCFISDPWTASGIHTLTDVRTQPQLSIATSMPEPVQGTRERCGINYRYISNRDYMLFMSDSLRQARNFQFDSDGECYVYDTEGTKNYVTVIWNCDANAQEFQNYFRDGWFKDKNYEGCLVYNDLVAPAWDHTMLFGIAPRAFQGVKELKRIVFISNIVVFGKSDCTAPLNVTIQEQAFKDSGIEELVMMYYNEKTDNWEVLGPTSGVTVADDAFEGTSGQIAVDPSVYQSYMGDKNWSTHRSRFNIYAAKVEDMKVNGAIYSYWRDNQANALKNSGEGNQKMIETLRYWNADYQQFNATSLLTNSDKNIWYTKVVGVDAGSLSDGTMRIYNDPGSYYNYKTIALESLGQSKDVKNIEFWQTNGRLENSYTDLKIVIRNGALKGCDNLKEIRLFYLVQDGDDHWQTLGPKDVIPGDDIFGLETYDVEGEDIVKALENRNNIKFIVSTNRLQEFMEDPNWQPYIGQLVAQDGPQAETKGDFKKEGVTYGYLTNPGGIHQTSQTVSQDVSWWTLPRIAIEVALVAASIVDSWASASKEVAEAKNQISQIIETIKENEASIQSWLNREQEMITIGTELWENGHIVSRQKAVDYILKFKEFGAEELGLDVGDGAYKILDRYGNAFIFGNQKENEILERLADLSDFDLQSLCIAYGIAQKGAIKNLPIFTKEYVDEIAKAIAKLPFGVVGKQSSANVSKAAAQYLQSISAVSRYITPGKGLPGALFSAIGANTILAQNLYGSGNYDAEGMRNGMRQNILSNIHQVGLVGGGYVITTPQKNLAYHTYIKDVPDETTVTLYTGTDEGGFYANTTTAAIAQDVFQGKKNVRTVQFRENEVTTNEAVPMVLVIPDSIFAGTSIHTLDLRLLTKENGTQAMGPESFILAGSQTFDGVDEDRFQIIIDPSRKDDFLFSESWAPYERFFTYESAAPKSRWSDYGAWYGLAYENGSVQRVHKVSGHKIEHTVVTEPDDKFLEQHGGGLKLCNDIGTWNNYQLDAVLSKAFYGNKKVTSVNFTDLIYGNTGDSYTDLDVTLQDSCFANCRYLEYLEMVYLVTDGTNHLDPITPQQVKIGRGVLDGTNARIKMMPQQVAWFEADSSWVAYKDRFMPCIIKPTDDGFKKALEGAAYYDRGHTEGDDVTWDEYADLSRVEKWGLTWLRDKLQENKDDILSLADFKHFESVDVQRVDEDMFKGLSKMTTIELPNTVKRILNRAFEDCSALWEIEIPAKVEQFWDDVFKGCTSLQIIRVRNKVPAELGENVFPKNEGMKIYVPAESLDAYLTAWAEYKDYIVSDADYNINKVVKLDTAGTLAEKLGLYVEWSYSGLFAGDEPRYIHGQYAKYDSLTVSGPLNDLDLWVIRYLAGNNGYERGGKATDGRLRYLNLYDASIKKDGDCKAHYLNLTGYLFSYGWHSIEDDNELPPYLFQDCTALETVILPKSLTSITHDIFIGCTALKHLAVTGALKEYDGWQYSGTLLTQPLEELVMLTDKHATSTATDPWGATIQQVYTYTSTIGDYMNDAGLTLQAQAINAPFKSDRPLEMLAAKGEFFPSEYLARESVEGLFTRSFVDDFDDFDNFWNVKRLEETFKGCGDLRRITLPASVEYIGADAFAYCGSLDTIRVMGTEPAELAEDAFRYLPKDFRILVPRRYAKLYRTEWAQYADHINADDTYVGNGDIVTVTVTKPNTLGKALGLGVNTKVKILEIAEILSEVRGDYSNIRKLKVVGPIGAIDLDLMRYMAGYCPWTRSRNFLGHLEYIDLYDAQLRSDGITGVLGEYRSKDGTVVTQANTVSDDILPKHAFLRAYNLKTLILPKTCKEVYDRAMQECEGMETLVIGDDMEDFNWNALDDDAMLTRMYILAKKKPTISTELPLWRLLCNNYNPTFDAFYVRPSQYANYLLDEAYTGSSWQRTNNISTGVFDDDESFCAFASHGAATQDELAAITSVRGWFDQNTGVRNLSPLRYTYVGYLDKATIAPLKELEQIAMPVSLYEMEEGLFDANRHLRSVDFLMCDSTDIISTLRNGGFAKYGINTKQTLAYVPDTYGQTDETNVVVNNVGTLSTKTYRMPDSLSYVVPYEFETEKIENPRTLAASAIPYTFCVPYKLNVPDYARAYKLAERDGNSLVFTEVKGELEPMKPYLLKVVGNKRFRKMSTTLNTNIAQTVPASGDMTYGRQDDALGYSLRGTFDAISNKDAADLGAYVLQSDGDWHPVTTAHSDVSLLPFRAFLMPSTRNAGARISMSIVDDTTSIDSIETIDLDGTRRYYDLNGREVDGTTKGIIISNGKKTIKR